MAGDGPGGTIGGSCDLFGLSLCSCSFVLEDPDASAAPPPMAISDPDAVTGDAVAASKEHCVPGLPCGPDDESCPLSGPSAMPSMQLADEVIFTARGSSPLTELPPPPVLLPGAIQTGEGCRSANSCGGVTMHVAAKEQEPRTEVLGRATRNLHGILSL